MISDVLSDASDKIIDYIARLPEVYRQGSPTVSKIERVLALMDELRKELDSPPDAPETR